jgi:hypothetical protein
MLVAGSGPLASWMFRLTGQAGDEGLPKCRRCHTAGRQCVRGWNVKFVHGVRSTREAASDDWDGAADYLFNGQQTWMPLQDVKCMCCHVASYPLMLTAFQ